MAPLHTRVKSPASGVGVPQRAGDVRCWIVLGLVGLGAFVPVRASAQDVVPGDVRQETPPGQRIMDAAMALPDTTSAPCTADPPEWSGKPEDEGFAPVRSCGIDRGVFPAVPAGMWYWSLYHHTLRRPKTRDTVRQDDLVLRFRATGTKDPVPIWHDRSVEAGPLPRPPRAARLGDALFMVHRRCLQGTGGCTDWPFRLGDGTVDPLRRLYLGGLRASIPEEWGFWKGVHLDPTALTAEAPVYVPADANCCASFRAEARVSVRGNSGVPRFGGDRSG